MSDEKNISVGTIPLHGVDYPVFIMDDEGKMIDGQLGHNYACVDFKKCIIKISKGSDIQRQKTSLLHEVLHLCLFSSKHENIEDAEDLIVRLEQSLSSMGVAEFLWDLYIEGRYNAETDKKQDEKKRKRPKPRSRK